MSELVRSKDNQGFTLIELLIVIAILAILVSIVAINVTGIMSGVTDTAMSTEKGLVQLAIDRYNSWDVAVNDAEPILADWIPTKVSPGTGTFGKYLSSETRYYYTWGDEGENLEVQKAP